MKDCENRAPFGGARKVSFGRPFGIIVVDGGNIVPGPADAPVAATVAAAVGSVGECGTGGINGFTVATPPLFECIESFLTVGPGPGYPPPPRPLYVADDDVDDVFWESVCFG